MAWNYRVIRCNHADGIHEVYYDVGGKIISWTENPVCVLTSTDESLVDVWQMMTKALLLPVLELDESGSLKETKEILLGGTV